MHTLDKAISPPWTNVVMGSGIFLLLVVITYITHTQLVWDSRECFSADFADFRTDSLAQIVWHFLFHMHTIQQSRFRLNLTQHDLLIKQLSWLFCYSWTNQNSIKANTVFSYFIRIFTRFIWNSKNTFNFKFCLQLKNRSGLIWYHYE